MMKQHAVEVRGRRLAVSLRAAPSPRGTRAGRRAPADGAARGGEAEGRAGARADPRGGGGDTPFFDAFFVWKIQLREGEEVEWMPERSGSRHTHRLGSNFHAGTYFKRELLILNVTAQ